MILLEITSQGWTMSLVAVSVVFSALFILFLIYNLSGNIFTGKFKRRPKAPKAKAGDDTAAAIALALELYNSDDDVPAAIAMALHLHLSESVHDPEPGFITIKTDSASAWKNKALTFRKKVH